MKTIKVAVLESIRTTTRRNKLGTILRVRHMATVDVRPWIVTKPIQRHGNLWEFSKKLVTLVTMLSLSNFLSMKVFVCGITTIYIHLCRQLERTIGQMDASVQGFKSKTLTPIATEAIST